MRRTVQRFLFVVTGLWLLYGLVILLALAFAPTATRADGLPAARLAGEKVVALHRLFKQPKPTKHPPKPTATPTETAVPAPPTATVTAPVPSPSPDLPTATPTQTAMATDTPPSEPSATLVATPTATATSPPAAERLQLTKTDFLSNDADGNNLVSPGDSLLYGIEATNLGELPVQQLQLMDTLDPNTALVVGSVQTTLGTVSQGNSPDDTRVTVAIATLAPGVRAILSFQVTIQAQPGDMQVENQAVATFATPAGGPGGQTVMLSDDPETTAGMDATVTPLNGHPPRPIRQVFLPLVVR
jgi:uncharacterized repeat protein (TIGR01451 family)